MPNKQFIGYDENAFEFVMGLLHDEYVRAMDDDDISAAADTFLQMQIDLKEKKLEYEE